MKKYDAFQLKVFMALLMVFDHLKHVPDLVPGDMQLAFHVITRPVSVWFAYILVEGFVHTRSKWKYNMRLASWAVFMALGNLLIGYLFRSGGIVVTNNIFATFAVSVLMLNVISYKSTTYMSKMLKVIIVLAVLAFGAIIGAEGFVPIIPFVLVTYSLRNKVKLRNIVYLLMSLVMLSMAYVPYDTVGMTIRLLAFNSDFMFISVLPFIYLYNGERGKKTTLSKYFFYIFYPAHLWILAIISYIQN